MTVDCPSLPSCCFASKSKLDQRGFSLIEMMIVVVILGILAAVAMPDFRSMLAEQRVRTVASDLVADLVLARTEAVKLQRRVTVERQGTTWSTGWTIYFEIDPGNGATPTRTVLKTAPALSASQLKLCALNTALASQIVFRGDGTVANIDLGQESGIRVVDDLGSGLASKAHVRHVVLSPAGRASVQVIRVGQGALCA